MVTETIDLFAGAAVKKRDFLNNNFMKYFLLSMFAGIFVGLGVILILSIGAPLKAAGLPFTKTVMGASFGVALTLVIFAGSELFTGNNMIMTIGALEKKVKWMDTIKLWVVCYGGNLVGSMLLGLVAYQAGLLDGITGDFVQKVSAGKMSGGFVALFWKGFLCNLLVCLAIWMSARTKEDTAKIFLIFWTLFAFITSGYEHSVANMTIFAMGLFSPHDVAVVNWAGFFNNLIPVTLGNIAGGAGFMGLGYWFIGSQKKKLEVK